MDTHLDDYEPPYKKHNAKKTKPGILEQANPSQIPGANATKQKQVAFHRAAKDGALKLMQYNSLPLSDGH